VGPSKTIDSTVYYQAPLLSWHGFLYRDNRREWDKLLQPPVTFCSGINWVMLLDNHKSL